MNKQANKYYKLRINLNKFDTELRNISLGRKIHSFQINEQKSATRQNINGVKRSKNSNPQGVFSTIIKQ